MTFKEIIQQDIQTFINPEEFGEKHMINSKECLVIIDDIEMLNREKRQNIYTDGLSQKQILLYIKKIDFGRQPKPDQLVLLDKGRFRVIDSINEDGILSITLEANVS